MEKVENTRSASSGVRCDVSWATVWKNAFAAFATRVDGRAFAGAAALCRAFHERTWARRCILVDAWPPPHSGSVPFETHRVGHPEVFAVVS